MITSWYWYLLLLWFGGIVVDGKAILGVTKENEVALQIIFRPVSLQLGVNSSVSFSISGNSPATNWSLILLQYEGEDNAALPNLTKVSDIQTGISLIKSAAINGRVPSKFSVGPTASQTISLLTNDIPVYLVGTNDTTPAATALQSLLFCIGPLSDEHNICNFYSEPFNLSPDSNGSQPPITGEATQPTRPAAVTTSTAISPASLPSSLIITSTFQAPQLTTFTPAPTVISTSIAGTVTATASLSATSSTTSAVISSIGAKPKSSLSTGAKIGIALGGFVLLFLLLLLALFFLRKKHSKRGTLRKSTSQPEQVLLTRDMHTDSFARNQLILEKERNVSSTAVAHDGIDSHVEEISPSTSLNVIGAAGGVQQQQQQRHSALCPYEALPSAPYTGSISPRRKMTTPTHAPGNNNSSTIANAFSLPPSSNTSANTTPQTQPQSQIHNTNTTTTSSQPPPSSSSSSSSTLPPTSHSNSHSHSPTPSTYEVYHDIPLYGDARHVPQVFSTSPHAHTHAQERERGIESPFLREEMEGMTPEEIARLEEEERRIDAAIAAAEARR